MQSIPKCDIIVATYWREIYECIEQKIAPVIYFEQGDFHLFDLSKVDDRLYKYIEKNYIRLNLFIQFQHLLRTNYKRCIIKNLLLYQTQ